MDRSAITSASLSHRLGCLIQYRVYTPANIERASNLPTIYITDGHEYLADFLGAAVIVLDNLIADKRLQPAMAVFVDPRDPDQLARNRRMEQYLSNQRFAEFLAHELVPLIDDAYPTRRSASARTIVGTSLGGLQVAHLGANHSEVFRNLGIQSPAFWVDQTIYKKYRDPNLASRLRIHMTMGTLHDDGGATSMEKVLSDFGYDYTLVKVNDGHSWGSWRAQLSTLFMSLVGSPAHESSYPVGWVAGFLMCGAVALSLGRNKLLS